jgi:hypothetical protein
MADKAFVSGMTEAMLIASVIMAGAALFVFAVLPAETHCIEEECQEQPLPVGLAAPASGD